MKTTIIDLLNKIANDTLEDNTRVIVLKQLYKYNKKDKKLYKETVSFNNPSIGFSANDLNIEVEILDNKEKTDNKVHIEEIDGKYLEEINKIDSTSIEALYINKINEIIRVVNKR